MKLIIFILFILFSQIATAQSGTCGTDFLGKFKVWHSTDSIEAFFFQSSHCSANNIAIMDTDKFGEPTFVYADSMPFLNCTSKSDSLVWLYFYIDKYKFDKKYIHTSKPYSNKSKKHRKYYYKSVFTLGQKEWHSTLTIQDNVLTISNINVKYGPFQRELCDYGKIFKVTEE